MRRLVLSLALFVACAACAGARGEDPRDLPLVDQRGSPFTLRQLRGEPVLVTFVATRCSDACPLANAEFARLALRLRGEHVGARLVTITLDPRYDTPFVMAREARALGADPRLWRVASGDPASVQTLMRAFGVVARADAAGIPDEHSTLVYVLDARARWAKTLLLSSGFGAEALRAIRSLPGPPAERGRALTGSSKARALARGARAQREPLKAER